MVIFNSYVKLPEGKLYKIIPNRRFGFGFTTPPCHFKNQLGGNPRSLNPNGTLPQSKYPKCTLPIITPESSFLHWFWCLHPGSTGLFAFAALEVQVASPSPIQLTIFSAINPTSSWSYKPTETCLQQNICVYIYIYREREAPISPCLNQDFTGFNACFHHVNCQLSEMLQLKQEPICESSGDQPGEVYQAWRFNIWFYMIIQICWTCMHVTVYSHKYMIY